MAGPPLPADAAPAGAVITGVGLVTPLGNEPRQVLRRVQAGESAFAPPRDFDPQPFGCPLAAEICDFRPEPFVAEAKLLRLMNRDAQLAVAAARLALADASLTVGSDCAPEEIGVFGATGLAGLPLSEVAPLLRASATADGRFDLARFGGAGLRAVRPILTFKILGNMPLCFVSLGENLQGPNAVYTPWEGQGAQALDAAAAAVECGDVRCAVAGGCDAHVHELAYLSLRQLGVFDSWQAEGAGTVPAEGAVFLVLESETSARARGARIYARLAEAALGASAPEPHRSAAHVRTLSQLRGTPPTAILAAGDGDAGSRRDEAAAWHALGIRADTVYYPKRQVGNLFAAAAALQVGLAAVHCEQIRRPVLADCFGHGSEEAAFRVEPL